jgi:hypothetical protein
MAPLTGRACLAHRTPEAELRGTVPPMLLTILVPAHMPLLRKRRPRRLRAVCGNATLRGPCEREAVARVLAPPTRPMPGRMCSSVALERLARVAAPTRPRLACGTPQDYGRRRPGAVGNPSFSDGITTSR